MSFQKEVNQAADQYALPYYDQNSEFSTREVIPRGTQDQRFSRQAGYSQPGYAATYTDRDVYTHPDTIRRSRENAPGAAWLDRVNTPQFLDAVATIASRQIKRQLAEAEQIRMRNYVIHANPRMFASFNNFQTANALARGFVDTLHRGGVSELIDTHEILKHEIRETGESDGARGKRNQPERRPPRDPRFPEMSVGSLMGAESKHQVLQLFNPEALDVEARLVLDSHYRKVDDPIDNKRYSWDILYDTQRSRGVANIIGVKVRDVSSVKALPLRIPNPTDTSGLTTYRRVHMLIHEFAPQSFAAQSGKNFHFIFRPDADGADHYNLDPAGDTDAGGLIEFDKKITKFEQITISFTDPVRDLTFLADRINSATWIYATPTTITLSANHGLVNGDLITMDNFTTSNTAADSGIIAAMNSNTHAITVLAPNSFTIPVNSAAIVGPLVNLIIPIFIEKRRMFIYLKIKFTTPEDEYP